MIRIQRRSLRKMAVLVALTLILGALTLTAAYLLWGRKDYLRAQEVWLRRDVLIGRQIRVRDYLQNSGIGQTVQACNPPEYAFTRFSLSRIDLIDCEVDECTMTCPLFAPHIGEAYEIVGTLAYCSNGRLCLIDISEIYLVEHISEELYGGQTVPVTPGPASFPVGQQWEP